MTNNSKLKKRVKFDKKFTHSGKTLKQLSGTIIRKNWNLYAKIDLLTYDLVWEDWLDKFRIDINNNIYKTLRYFIEM